MKRKLKIMLFILISMCVTAHSQSLSLTGPTTVNSGEAFTLTVANEKISQYLGSFNTPLIDYDNPPNNASYVLATYIKSALFNAQTPGTPSKLDYKLVNTYGLPIKVKMTFSNVVIFNGTNASQTNGQLTYTITVNPSTAGFPSVEKTGVFYKNDCGAGYTSDPYTYTVPAGRYIAQSQSAADASAQQDLMTNGQIQANANRTCILLPISIVGITSGWRNQEYDYNVSNTSPGDSYVWTVTTNGATILGGQGTSRLALLFKDIPGTIPYNFVISVTVTRPGVETRTATLTVTSKFCANCPK